MSEKYTGSVCYKDGWHYSVISDGNGGEVPDAKLYLDHETGEYRFASDTPQININGLTASEA